MGPPILFSACWESLAWRVLSIEPLLIFELDMMKVEAPAHFQERARRLREVHRGSTRLEVHKWHHGIYVSEERPAHGVSEGYFERILKHLKRRKGDCRCGMLNDIMQLRRNVR